MTSIIFECLHAVAKIFKSGMFLGTDQKDKVREVVISLHFLLRYNTARKVCCLLFWSINAKSSKRKSREKRKNKLVT